MSEGGGDTAHEGQQVIVELLLHRRVRVVVARVLSDSSAITK
jgi:hypothetical protein